MDTTEKNIRYRDLLTLGALAATIGLAYLLIQDPINRQENYARGVNMATSQTGLTNFSVFLAVRWLSPDTKMMTKLPGPRSTDL